MNTYAIDSALQDKIAAQEAAGGDAAALLDVARDALAAHLDKQVW